MEVKELAPIGPKTTMRIGGQARFYADILTKDDVDAAVAFAAEKKIPLIVLGGGSNTIFSEGVTEALVVRIKYEAMTQNEDGSWKISAGKIMGSLLNDLAEKGFDLSPLTGIPGMLGGALFGNAGQGAGGIWLDRFVRDVTVFMDGRWQTLTKEECKFGYRESLFKEKNSPLGSLPVNPRPSPLIIWEATLVVPTGDPEVIKLKAKAEIERLIQKRIETQPHVKTAGSCFKSLPDGTPAWKLIDAAGLRGTTIGGVQVSEKHANFLLNVNNGTFKDACDIVSLIKSKVPGIAGIEMRFYKQDGSLAF